MQHKAAPQLAPALGRRLRDHTAHPQLASNLLRQQPAARRRTNHYRKLLVTIPVGDLPAQLLGDVWMFKNTELFPVLVAMPPGTEQKMPTRKHAQLLKKLKHFV